MSNEVDGRQNVLSVNELQLDFTQSKLVFKIPFPFWPLKLANFLPLNDRNGLLHHWFYVNSIKNYGQSWLNVTDGTLLWLKLPLLLKKNKLFEDSCPLLCPSDATMLQVDFLPRSHDRQLTTPAGCFVYAVK